MLGVVLLGRGLVEPAQLACNELQLLALEARDDLTDEPALDAVGFAEHKGAISAFGHERGSLRVEASSSKTGGYTPGCRGTSTPAPVHDDR